MQLGSLVLVHVVILFASLARLLPREGTGGGGGVSTRAEGGCRLLGGRERGGGRGGTFSRLARPLIHLRSWHGSTEG